MSKAGGDVEWPKLLGKARRYLRSAELLLADGDLASTVSRLYYAQFFAAEAMLSRQGVSFSSHRAVISAFGRNFVLPGLLDPEFHRLLVSTFQKRQLAEYLAEPSITPAECRRVLRETTRFLERAEEWLESAERQT